MSQYLMALLHSGLRVNGHGDWRGFNECGPVGRVCKAYESIVENCIAPASIYS